MLRALVVTALLSLAGCTYPPTSTDAPPITITVVDKATILEAIGLAQAEGISFFDLSPEQQRRVRLLCIGFILVRTPFDDSGTAFCELAQAVAPLPPTKPLE